MPTRLSSVAIRAESKRRPAQRSSDRKYGMASRHMVDKDEAKPVTGTSGGSVSSRRRWCRRKRCCIRRFDLIVERAWALRPDIAGAWLERAPRARTPWEFPAALRGRDDTRNAVFAIMSSNKSVWWRAEHAHSAGRPVLARDWIANAHAPLGWIPLNVLSCYPKA